MLLAERDDQLTFLLRMFTDCAAGQAGVAWLEGPVAIGRSALLTAFAERAAESGAVVLTAEGIREERAVPLGVLRQLFRNVPLPADTAATVERTLEDGAFAAWVSDIESDAGRSISRHVLQGLGGVVLELAAAAPVVICLDDVQHADAESLQFLLHLVRWCRSARLFVLIGERQGPQPAHMSFRVELQRQPHCRRLKIEPLTLAGVEQVLRERLPDSAGEAEDFLAATGGNPLLLHAAIDDRQRQDETEEHYRDAVVDCLYRSESIVQRALQALAVLGVFGTICAIAQFLDAEVSFVERVMHGLDAAGLLTRGQFRRPAARTAVHGTIYPDILAEQHQRAAGLLYADGGDATAVAEHLFAAGEHDTGPWAVPVLREAAEAASHAGRVERAVEYLKLAHRISSDKSERLTVQAMLAYVGWRVNPSVAVRNVPELVEATRNGTLRGAAVYVPIWYLLWFGRGEEAAALLEQLIDETGPGDPETAAEVWRAWRWLTTLYPGIARRLPPAPSRLPAKVARSVAINHQVEAMAVLGKVLERQADDDLINAAGRLLRMPGLDDRTISAVVSSLHALVGAGRLSQAAQACDAVLDRLAGSRAPTWRAVLMSIRAEISYRTGDLNAAGTAATEALTIMPAESWGITVGAPRGAAIMVAVAMGDLERAADHLNQPVPPAMFHTPYWVNYLIARGRYRVATGAARSAVEDFSTCGDMLGSWGLDLSALFAWRTEAAWAHLELGDARRARELATGELARAGDDLRVRGGALRVLAASGELAQRPPILREAVEALQAAGDNLTLAHALAELSRAHQGLGQSSQARMLLHRAAILAHECHATALYRSLRPDAGPETEEVTFGNDRIAALSEAERRVSLLAAKGHTNQEIARKLYITVSTVEQHLTRIYRKLEVNRRSELLPLDFRSWHEGSAGAGVSPT